VSKVRRRAGGDSWGGGAGWGVVEEEGREDGGRHGRDAGIKCRGERWAWESLEGKEDRMEVGR
jgi:hypothetical protein